MDYNIDWLFEKVYEIKSGQPLKKLNFLSDWDCFVTNDNDFCRLLDATFENAKNNSAQYLYSYDQFQLKATIYDYFNKNYQILFAPGSLTITPSSTTSINLAMQSLKVLDKQRCLVLTPAYFSTINSIQQAQLTPIYYHLFAKNNFQIDCGQIEKIISEQYIDCIILTDPIYSTGVKIDIEIYNQLIAIANCHNIYLIVDHSLGGLDWNCSQLQLFPNKKLSALTKCTRFCFIDSLPKRLFINGVKFSLVFGCSEIVDKIDKIAESVYGALNSVQTEFLKTIFTGSFEATLLERMRTGIDEIKKNYSLMKSIVSTTDYFFPECNTGYFTYLLHKKTKINEINTIEYLNYLIEQFGIVGLTNDKLGFFKEDYLGLRINLHNSFDELATSIRECCRLPLNTFNKR